MAIVHPHSPIWSAAAVVFVFGVFIVTGNGRPLWAGQEEQFDADEPFAVTGLAPSLGHI